MDSSQEKLANIISKLKNNCLSFGPKVAVNYGCPKVFDGFYCWPETKPGVLAEQLCSNDFLMATNKTELVTKQCTENGSWYMKMGSERPWTNFSQCGNIHYIDVEATRLNNETSQMCAGWLRLIKDTTNVGYGLSIVALFFALVIFIKLKRLHCERNKLHVNLFATYVLRALIYFAKNAFFFEGSTLVNDVRLVGDQTGPDYAWMCKLFTSIQFYVTTCNFTFMLMEGLYLHNLIFLNLVSESHGTTIYCALGWAIPVLFIVPWIVLKILFENVYCWTQIESEYIVLFLEVPIGITVIVNFALFTIIMRVLIMKLHFTSTFTNHKQTKCRKLLKSTLILIPLYGFPYTISLALRFVLHLQRSNSLEMIWMFFDQTFTSFQGLFAALVYCLLNDEVQKEVFRKYNSLVNQTDKEFRRSRTLSTNTQNVSLPNDDAVENLKLVGIIDEETANLHLANSGT